MDEKKSPLPITDKLVEFSQKTVVQEQMVNSMNSIINNMRIPGAGNPLHKENDINPNEKEEKQNES